MLLNCNCFLVRVPPLLAYDLSNSLFWCCSSPVFLLWLSSYSNLTTASPLLYSLGGIATY